MVPEMVNGLQDNLDVVVSVAERHYYNCDFKMCYKLTSMQVPSVFVMIIFYHQFRNTTGSFTISLYVHFRVMVKDPFHANCLPVHIGTLVELGKANGKKVSH